MRSVVNQPAPWKTILSIADQPATLALLADCLTAHGHHMITATSGEEAMRKVAVVRPDLILLDLHMPGGMDGFETCRRLKDDPTIRDVPLIFMTFSDSRADRLKGFEAGAVDYVTKPLDELEVMARIRAHLAVSDMRRTLARQNATLREEALSREQVQEELRRTHVELQQLAMERATRLQAQGGSAGLRRLLKERDDMLAERDDMLRLLTHEVEQPLNNASDALVNASSAISAVGDAAGIGTEPLIRARHVLDHAIGTVNNALAVATLLPEGFAEATAETDLDTLVSLLLEDIAADQRERVVVERKATARTVHIQPVLMRLALCKLLAHGLNSSAAKVTLTLSDVDEPPAIAFQVSEEGTGTIAGPGAGLHFVRRVVALHRGQVEVIPNPPAGRIARITIPQAPPT